MLGHIATPSSKASYIHSSHPAMQTLAICKVVLPIILGQSLSLQASQGNAGAQCCSLYQHHTEEVKRDQTERLVRWLSLL